MAVTNLSELRAEVKDWGNRSNISDSLVDSFINTAQTRANRILRLPNMEAISTLTITDGVAPIPADYEEAREMVVESGNKKTTLERKSIHHVDMMSSYSGTPTMFARKTTNFHVAPTGGDVSTVDLYYYIKLPALVDDTDTNFFITESPDLLKYGALTEMFLYIRDDQNAALYEAKYRSVLQELQGVEDTAMWSGKPLAITL